MSALERYIPFEIYKNIKDLLEYRNVKHDHVFMSKEKFMERLDFGFIKIDGVRENSHGKRPASVILISPTSKAATNVPNFKVLMKKIPQSDLENNIEIMFISETPFTNFIKSQIRSDRAKYPGVYIEHFEYPIFSIVIPRHVMVPKHEIMPEAEVRKFCEEYKTQRTRFGVILTSDPAVVWLGARPGDVIKIYRESESSGHEIGLRTVKKAPL